MRFTKMHGIGNDYVYVDGVRDPVADPVQTARRVSDRHFGVGSDGLILILPPTPDAAKAGADIRMRMFNADGSESEMCGNGVRCVAKYAWDHGLTKANPVRIETGRGILTLSLELDAAHKLVRAVTVDMGEPILDPTRIPVNLERLDRTGKPHTFRVTVAPVSGGPTNPDTFEAVFVSMGNPHAVIYMRDVQSIDLARVGPLLENHPAFPRRINVHFVQVLSDHEVIMRTWERGSGITLACGTGACAVAVAGILTSSTGRELIAHLPGGDLRLEWKATDNHVHMTGPATEVFSGEWNATEV